MDKIATDNLFLIEFLVDRVQLDPNLTQDIGDVMGDTCVTVQFLDNSPLDICEDDFTPKREYKKENDGLKSGKSCLFSLTPSQAEEGLKQFDVFVDIFKKTQKGAVPDKMQVGSSLVSIVNLFKELIESLSSPSTGANPTAKTLKDSFKITNASGEYIGDIAIYIRMSCFGKLIVTQFQMNLDDKSVLFKDKEGHSLYRYKKASSRDHGSASGKRGSYGQGGAGAMGGNNGRNTAGGYDDQCGTSCPTTPCPPRPRMSAGYATGGGYSGGGSGGRCETACPTVACNSPSDMNYQQNNMQSMTDDSCACTVGNMGKKKKSKVSYGGDSNCQVPGPAVNFELPDAAAQAPYSFTLAGCGFQSQNPNAAPEPAGSCTSRYPKAVADANHDVFILKVSEKKDFKPKKNNIELEMTTPRGPVIKPRPRRETRQIQCDPEPKGKKGGGKGGGKGKKGKK